MNKPRNYKTQNISLTGHETSKGKRYMILRATRDAITKKQAMTLANRMINMAAWCNHAPKK